MNENHVHVEREKTKRTLIVAIAITVVGLVCAVLFFQNIDNRGGALKITSDGVEVSLEKPIVTQVHADTINFKVLGEEIPVTTGTVSGIEIEGGQDSGGFVGKRFNGKNLIDTAAGFILASANPDRWQVQKPVAGSDVLSKLTAADGSLIEIRSVPLKGLPPLDEYVTKLLDSFRVIDPKAKVIVPDTATSRMIWYTNPDTKVIVCMKIVDANAFRHFVYSEITKPEALEGIRNSVAGFTVITKQPALRKSVAPTTKRLLR